MLQRACQGCFAIVPMRSDLGDFEVSHGFSSSCSHGHTLTMSLGEKPDALHKRCVPDKCSGDTAPNKVKNNSCEKCQKGTST
jgi:hypothetical protein